MRRIMLLTGCPLASRAKVRRVTALLLGLMCTLLTAGPMSSGGVPVYIVVSVPTGAHLAPFAGEPMVSSCPAVGDLADGLMSRLSEPAGVTGLEREVIVRVLDEVGGERVRARVYHNGHFVGLTGEGGTISLPNVGIGDQLAALYPVAERPSLKGHHDLDGSGNWAWRVYETNVRIADDGRPELFRVEDVSIIQDLIVRQEQPLVGFHVVACVEWDADRSYLADLRRGLEKASALLYDVGDGQLFWEVIEIWDAGLHWADCDIRILASNEEWPKAAVWGITKGEGVLITMGRHFNSTSSNSGRWAAYSGFHALVHEFGHYGLGLHDEYLNAQGKGVTP